MDHAADLDALALRLWERGCRRASEARPYLEAQFAAPWLRETTWLRVDHLRRLGMADRPTIGAVLGADGPSDAA